MAEAVTAEQLATRPARWSRPGAADADGAGETRRACIAEALWELQRIFDEPGCFGDCSAGDAAATLASELVGAWRDEEVVARLAKFSAAERAGAIREAARHLGYVRRKLADRWAIVPVPSQPLLPEMADEYPAWRTR